MRRWWRSHGVRVRLTFWYLAAMVIVLGLYAALVFTFVSRNASETLNGRLRGDFQWASAMVDQTPEGGFTWYEDTAEEESPWLQVWSPDGDVLYQNFEARRRPLPQTRDLALRADDSLVAVASEAGPVRVLTRRGRIGSKPVVIQVARSEATMRQELRQLVLIFVLGLPIAVAMAGLGGYTLARRALLPVERMTERAHSITADRLSDRLVVEHPDDEMGRLATVFNETLGRLESSFAQMRQFTADVSHELRTPLTAIRSVGEVGLREHRDEVAYRGIIGSMLEEADRLASLVDRLLTLSRAETGQAKLSLEVFDLGALAEEVAWHLEVLAEEKRQAIAVDRVGTPEAYADRIVVRQAVINLVDNAIKFSPVGGGIRIRVAGNADDSTLDVIDSGSGIDAAAHDRIFDRFYRVARVSDGATGAGLGLSIAKGAVDANGGRLTLAASGADGSTFRIALPRAAPRDGTVRLKPDATDADARASRSGFSRTSPAVPPFPTPQCRPPAR
ncbi:MAG: HAMP domain-containing protein [Acidobacteria bacterium]|nr:HAMP domain-containing protein [Acidobacteriota bacterium]